MSPSNNSTTPRTQAALTALRDRGTRVTKARRAVINVLDSTAEHLSADEIAARADDSFDAVTISFGLRNFVDASGGLQEMLRVTKPGGRLVVCEFSRPTWPPFRAVYLNYLMRALPFIATKVSSDPESYVYLAESVQDWPDQRELAVKIADAGWGRVTWDNLSGGVVALHHSFKPAP